MKELWVPLSGAIAQQRKVETIANNVANANTTGFKKDQLTFKEHLTAYERGVDIDLPNKEWAPEDFYRSYGAEKAMVKVDGSYTDFTQGQISPTNNPLDLALQGKGFFEVLTPNGVRYTRSGRLSLSREGYLVTNKGFKVLSKTQVPEGTITPDDISQIPKPEERFIQLGVGSISINLQGQIFQQGNQVGELSVVEFQNPTVLRKEGNSLFINRDGNNIARSVTTAVHQGALEGSNVNTVQEMSNLIKAQRNFESIQKVMKTYDSMAAKSYNEIGKF